MNEKLSDVLIFTGIAVLLVSLVLVQWDIPTDPVPSDDDDSAELDDDDSAEGPGE
jgi:hypothetical protein